MALLEDIFDGMRTLLSQYFMLPLDGSSNSGYYLTTLCENLHFNRTLALAPRHFK